MLSKKTYRKRVSRKPKRTYRKKTANKDVAEWASLSCTRTMSLAGGAQFNVNALYNTMNIQLQDYDRAVTVSNAYQHYRIKKVTMTFKPSFDSYLATGGASSKPNIYYQIDKSGSVPTNITLEGLKQMGCKPRALDEKPVKISWSPSVLEGVMYASGAAPATSPSKYRISPWLSTNADAVDVGFNPSAIDHLGLYWYVDQLVNPQGNQYSIDIEVQFQFKKPLDTNYLGTIPAIPAQLAERNTSPDGVVGGGDGI